ncbi:MAG: DHH family phosphoesterase, partial [Candidatus Saccharimonadales bacterium]
VTDQQIKISKNRVMDNAKKQLADKIKSSNNILVTVSRDPSVDQLASCIGLTLLLNKQSKHTAAVFSGKVPSTLEFLKPDETLEKNTDSLRDFIISLDKSKADKLRYKVEEDVVRIFITPYKTSLSADDLEFSEGDFNVDAVVALGVSKQEDLDQAITAHGRILHDATVTSVNIAAEGGVGTINWHDPQASSLSELVTDLSQALGDDLLDEQIATALLTGIVSETGRFSNERTSSQTMSASAALLSAGANQKLVATKLEEKPAPAKSNAPPDKGGQASAPDSPDGVLEIDHIPAKTPPAADSKPPAAPPPPPAKPPMPPPHPPSQPPAPKQQGPTLTPGAKIMTEPPTLGGTLTASDKDETLEPVTDPLSLPTAEPPELKERKPANATPPPATPPQAPPPPAPAPSHITPPPPGWTPPPSHLPPATPVKPPSDNDHTTLADIEKSVGSPHAAASTLEDVRDEVNQALTGSGANEPIEALNAQPLGEDLHQPAPPAPGAAAPPPPPPAADDKKDDNAPPPVPPPIPFQFGNPPPSS